MVQDAARAALEAQRRRMEHQADELFAEDKLDQMTAKGFWDELRRRMGW